MPAEPWMRGTHKDLDSLRRGVVHALELALEDAERWAEELSPAERQARPWGLSSVAFHLRHAARSLDRLLTYAEDGALDEKQLAALSTEHAPVAGCEDLEEFRRGLASAIERVRRVRPESYEEPRGIGRQRLPTTVAGLLIHCADHTQRHAGQMVSTAQAVRSASAGADARERPAEP